MFWLLFFFDFGFPWFGCVLCVGFVFFGLFLFFVLGGFKSQVRWPKGPPHCLNPPYLVCFVVGLFWGFLCWLLFLLLFLRLFFIGKV